MPNRDKAPHAFKEELERGFALISQRPDVGAVATNANLRDVRRIHLARVRYYLYYRVKEAGWRFSPCGIPAGDEIPFCLTPTPHAKVDQMNQKELSVLFRKLGASDPEGWARSQFEEGSPQLARFLFLRQAWRQIVDEGDPSWIEQSIQRAQAFPDEPFAGVGHALNKLRARGATDDEITDVVRGMQAQVLFQFCYLLEDLGDVEEEVADVTLALVQLDEEGNPLDNVGGLHESVLETDPTGRQMRPRRGKAG